MIPTRARGEILADAVKDAVRQANKAPGQQMPNGATILAQRRCGDTYHKDMYGEEFIVLAVSMGFQPFVTWRRLIGVQQLASTNYGPLDYCVWGHYFQELGAALADFEERT